MSYKHLLAGNINLDGTKKEYYSPIDKASVGNMLLLESHQILPFFSKLNRKEIIKSEEILKNFRNLASKLKELKKDMQHQIVKETGYTLSDSGDIVGGAITLLKDYNKHINVISAHNNIHPYDFTNRGRILSLQMKPYGTVAAITAQNAPLILEVTVLVNALYAGNCVIIKPSTQTAGVTSLLIEALSESFDSKLLSKISILTCKAPAFLESAYQYADVIHFIGSSKYISSFLTNGLSNGKEVIFDGEGGSIVLIDKSADIEKAAEICKNSIIRCNGELCTSLQGIIVEKSVKMKFLKKLNELLTTIKVGNPFDPDIDMGPLFSINQIEEIKNMLKNKNKIVSKENYTNPIVLAANEIKSTKELLYGPIAWIETYEEDKWKKVLNEIPYSMSDVYVGTDKQLEEEFIQCSRAPRIEINIDPTEESPFEPWGGNLPTGYNSVGYWLSKYQKVFQIDKMNI